MMRSLPFFPRPQFNCKHPRRLSASSLLTSLFCVALFFQLTLSSALAQSTASGTISGQVTDSTKAVIPGATITIVDKATGTSRITTTNDVGRYIFVNVAPGTYDLKVTKTGF